MVGLGPLEPAIPVRVRAPQLEALSSSDANIRSMPGRNLSYTEEEAREAIAASNSWAESLRNLGLCTTGGSWRILRKYAEIWGISTEHFDPDIARRNNLRQRQKPLCEVLVEKSRYPRKDVKRRLLADGLKTPQCELCGQGDVWRGRPMSLILDHINGVRDDHRLENLRIVCPNCAATLDTHCGRKNRIERGSRRCLHCDEHFVPSYATQRYCSRRCGVRWDRSALRGKPAVGARKVERPPYDQLLAEIEATSHLAVGRKYGVSDNAVRKWIRFYERQIAREAAEGAECPGRVDPVRDAA